MAVTEPQTVDVESGLDVLDLPQPQGAPSRWRRAARVVVPKIAAAVVLVGIWQLLVTVHLWPDYVLPSPGVVWRTLSDQARQGTVANAVWTSVRHGAEGYVIAVLIGTPLGLLIARVQLVRLAIGSLIAALQSLPSVTWVPVGIIWFGLSQTTILFVVVMGAVPSIAGGMVAAVDTIPPLLLRVGDAMHARGLDRYRFIVLPAALPGYIAGLKQAWSFSWRSLMAAELIASGPDLGLGLGQLLDTGRAQNDIALMLATILLILGVGVLVDVLIFAPLDRGVRRRRGLAAA
ncbi:MAG TPA: ABC transporter permease [Candidatus Sulfotelmatobacter sp.]|nr:ABC transporter permease [Candidatus Sulfotelmatobacter sp.]